MSAPNLIHQSLPPPLVLRDDDLVVGRIDGDIVHFHGFESAGAASRAAAVAHQAMLRRLARGNGGAPSASEGRADARPVASVLRSSIGDRRSGGGDYAFEIRVPAPIDDVRMRGMAYVMYRALRSSGVA